MRYIYYTKDNHEKQQRFGIKQYLSSRGIFWGDCTTLLCDYEIDTPNYNVGITNMLAGLHEGDIIYVWDLSVLSNNLDGLFTILLSTSQAGISFIQCLDGEVISSKSTESLALIKGIGVACRIIFEMKSRHSKHGIKVKKRMLEENGGFFNKRGEWSTHIGARKGADMTKARAESARLAQIQKKEWQDSSIGYQWAVKQFKSGVPSGTIISEFNLRHESNPKDYSTRQGKPLCVGVLYRWVKDYEMRAIPQDLIEKVSR